jgi:hypothetical protein
MDNKSQKTRTTSYAVIAILAALALAIAPLLTAVTTTQEAFAQTPIACTNSGGNQPAGQQPICKGKDLTQISI